MAGVLIRQAFAHADRVLPVRRVAESESILAFHHPVPSFKPVHVLLVPKVAIRSVMHLGDAQREQVAAEIETLAPESLARLGLPDAGFVVVVNGGSRQDVRQLHFHLVTAGYPLSSAPSTLTAEQWTDVVDRFWDVHQVRPGSRPVLAGLERAVAVRDALRLDHRGYSIVWDARSNAPTGAAHLLAD